MKFGDNVRMELEIMTRSMVQDSLDIHMLYASKQYVLYMGPIYRHISGGKIKQIE